MPKKIDPRLIEILTKYGESAEDALWDCHGTWVAYHKAIERIAAKAGVKYDAPQVLVAERDAAAILVSGTLDSKSEWSIGEAAINLNYRVSGKQAAYPFAMAEKRAKDRVVLKLIGLHGLVYSEEESDDFKPGNDEPPKRQTGYRDDGTRTSYALKKEQPDLMETLVRELNECKTLVSFEKLKAAWRKKATEEKWNKPFTNSLKEKLDHREGEIRKDMERLAESSSEQLADLPTREAIEHSLKMHPVNAG